MASGSVMIEAGRMAHLAYLSRVRRQRLDWDAHRIPDVSEGFRMDTFTQDNETWFKAKSHLTFQHASVVLVEKTVDKEDRQMDARNPSCAHMQDALSMQSPSPAWQTTSRILRTLELSTEGFMDFLFSDRWKDGGLLRVLKGQLLDRLLHMLTLVEKYHDVVNYSTMAYIIVPDPIVPCRRSVKEKQGVKLQKVRVQLEMYCPNPAGNLANLATNNIKCNIRGVLEPLPHTNCVEMQHHNLREPFLQRQQRLQSGLSAHQASSIENVPGVHKQRSDRWQDDYFLGLKESQGNDLVSENCFLEHYTSDDDERPGFTRKGAAFSSQRSAIESQEKKLEAKLDMERLAKERKIANEKGKETSQRNQTNVKEKEKEITHFPSAKKDSQEKNTTRFEEVDEVSYYEAETVCHPVNFLRAEKIENELAAISTDMLIINNTSFQEKRVCSDNKLRKALAKQGKLRGYKPPCITTSSIVPKSLKKINYQQKQIQAHEKTTNRLKKTERAEIISANEILVVSSLSADNLKQGRKKSKIGIKPIPIRQYKPMKRWEKNPAFNEFVYYISVTGENKTNKTSFREKSRSLKIEEPTISQQNDLISSGRIKNSEEQSLSTSTSIPKISKEGIRENRQTSTRLNQTHSERAKQNDVLRSLPSHATTASGVNLLSEKQQELIQSRCLIISDMDPWHISVQLSSSSEQMGIDRNSVVQRRERIFKILNEGKVILALNKSRLWSLVRKVPKQTKETEKDNISTAPDQSNSVLVTFIPNNEVIPTPNNLPNPRNNVSLASNKLKTKIKQPKTIDDQKVNKAWEPEDTLTTIVPDDQLPDDITSEQMFELLNVNKHFVIGKLTSAYSFDHFFESQMGDTTIKKQRNKYKHLLTDQVKKKKPLNLNREKGPGRQKKGTDKNPPIEECVTKIDAVQEETEVNETQSSPLEIGKLKTFKFLQHKDYVPDSCTRSRNLQFAKVLTDEELFEYILLALKVYVVRKERASTAEPFSSYVSVTFSRRPLEDQRMMDMLGTNSGAMQVASACRTLAM